MFKKVCIFSGNANPALAQEIAQVLEMPLGQCPGVALQRRRDVLRDPGERARRRRVRHPADVLAGERQRDGAADHGRRAPPRVGRLDHRGHPLLRLRPAGPQGRAAHADHLASSCADLIVAAGVNRVRLRRPARRADPGLFQHPVRSPLRDAGLPRGLPAKNFDQRRRASSRPMRAAWSARAPTPSASTPRSPSSTSAASAPTRARSCTSSAT